MAPFMDYIIPTDTSSASQPAHENEQTQDETIFLLLALLPILLLGLALFVAIIIISRNRPSTAGATPDPAPQSRFRPSVFYGRARTDSAAPLLPSGQVAGSEMDSAPPTPTLASSPFAQNPRDSVMVAVSKYGEEEMSDAEKSFDSIEEPITIRETEAFKTQPTISQPDEDEANTSVRVSGSFHVLLDPTPHGVLSPSVPSIRVCSSTGTITELAVGLTSFSSAERLRLKRHGSVLQSIGGDASVRKLRHRQLQCIGGGKENAGVLGHSVSTGNVRWTPVLHGGRVQQSASMPNVGPRF